MKCINYLLINDRATLTMHSTYALQLCTSSSTPLI